MTAHSGGSYKVPVGTRIGHVHLKVSDLSRSIEFYTNMLGFTVMQYYGDQAAFLSDGEYHHLIGLNTWHSKGRSPAALSSPGLYHLAILYPSRRDLAVILSRLSKAAYPLDGASDHGVSEALYLRDPDGIGVELYWDKPRDQWPFDDQGNLQMKTLALNLNDLLKELDQ